jgi:cyclopropane fatty-acyl-phospholipid synthase-like methyltransferase
MSVPNWKEIWGKRKVDAAGLLDLDALIKLDGFDTGAGRIEAPDWQTYAEIISKKLGLRDGDSVYELGCGSGAFLYALRQRNALTVGGLDYSAALISAASRAIPDGKFVEAEAKFLDTDTRYDHVISNGVFHYFPKDYASDVVARMVKKAKKSVAIMEVPDLQTRQESENIRRDALSQEEYEKKYAGLEHTYYERSWFEEQAITHGCSCEIFDGCVPNYAQNRFRFGVLFKKP